MSKIATRTGNSGSLILLILIVCLVGVLFHKYGNLPEPQVAKTESPVVEVASPTVVANAVNVTETEKESLVATKPAATPAPRDGNPRRSELLATSLDEMHANRAEWATVVILPHPRLQTAAHDAVVKAYLEGALKPLCDRTTAFFYTNKVTPIPVQHQPVLGFRHAEEDMAIAILRNGEYVYYDFVPASSDCRRVSDSIAAKLVETLNRWRDQER